MSKRNFILLLIGFAIFLSSCNPAKNESRLQLHFHADRGWVGEPSGLVYLNGKYNMFYQNNSSQPVAGNFHWGHAISSDLVHWKKLPVALSPDTTGQMNTGSVVADVDNTSGLGSSENPPLIAFYTYLKEETEVMTTESESHIFMAYSLDEGRSWKKYEYPVLVNSNSVVFRKPNVKWDNLSKRWLMTVAVDSSILFYTSTDCIQWSFLSEYSSLIETNGGWKSSDFFSLNDPLNNTTKWVLMVSMEKGPSHGAPAIRYFIGDFDGTQFKSSQHQELWVDYGKDHYGGMTVTNLPDDRKIMLGWMDCLEYADQTPDEYSRGGMVFPRELRLITEEGYFILGSMPVKELNSLTQKSYYVDRIEFEGNREIFQNISFPEGPIILQLQFDNSNRFAIWGPREYGVRFKTSSGKSLSIGYNGEMRYFYIDRAKLLEKPFSDLYEQKSGAGYTVTGLSSDWYILVDNGSVELFACNGQVVISSLYYSDEKFKSIELYSEAGESVLQNATIREIEVNPK